ncbi:MAG: flagella basal body P-ring formation protein FlgA [Planctomycetota bacterium]|nr:MAG: flagella basal body P-ring formation protein FlgA [Planctomycetota bacterium]
MRIPRGICIQYHSPERTYSVPKSPLRQFRRAGGRATLSGGRAPWTGRQRFSISGEAAVATAVYARVDRQEMALTALRSIARGELIRRGDVQLQPHVGALPAGALASIEAAIGKEAVQTIRAESLVTANQVRMPTIVRRGERVSVRARAAGVTVRTFAVAQQDGGLGDLVTVQAIDGKERFTARVAGLRELEIMAAGVSAADVAAAVR